jgi:hypothetical protein
MPFSVNQSGKSIPLREPIAGAGSVFPGTPREIVRHTDVKHAECLVRHDVDPSSVHGASVSDDLLTNPEAGSLLRSLVFRRSRTIPHHPQTRPWDRRQRGALIDPRVEPGDNEGGVGPVGHFPAILCLDAPFRPRHE